MSPGSPPHFFKKSWFQNWMMINYLLQKMVVYDQPTYKIKMEHVLIEVCFRSFSFLFMGDL